MFRKQACVLFIGLGATLTGCESGSGATSIAVLTPSIEAFSAQRTAVELSVGTTTTIGLTVQRGGHYAGSISLTVEGLPTGVTATFAPVSLSAVEPNATLTLAAASSAPTGTQTITIRARGAEVAEKTVTIALTIAVPGITIATGGGSIAATVGSSTTVPITITRTGGFIDPVTLSVANLPAEMTAGFSPQIIPANSTTSIMTLSPAIGTPIGVASIAVRGDGIGLTTTSVSLPITIVDAPQPVFRLSLAFPVQIVGAGSFPVQNTVNIFRAGGFTGPVTLALEGAPAGTSVVFSPQSTSSASSTVSISVPLSANTVNTPVTIRGKAAGPADATVGLTLNVQRVPAIDVRPALASIAMARGSTRNVVFTILRAGGYAEMMTINTDALPNGFTASPSFPIISAATTTATIVSAFDLTVSNAVAPGDYVLTLRGTGVGVAASAQSFTVTVTP